MNRTWTLSLLLALSTTITMAQAPETRIDFSRDVLPIFRQNCVGCHGPAQQNGGLRLDRRSSAMKSGSRRVSAGSSENSFLYHRLAGTEYGPQMPPTGPLRPEQIATIKRWIDQGAEWPDALANDAPLPPIDPKAVAMVGALHDGDLVGFLKQASADPKLLNARGPEGSTPFMYAALYADAATLAGLLKQGADPNARNDVKATALIWAAVDLEKTRVLVEHGADVNAASDDFRTPLMIAARRPGGSAIVKYLLDHGANPNPNRIPAVQSSPLIEAATAGDRASMQVLIDHGADAKAAGQAALSIAIALECAKCVDLLTARISDKAVYTGSLQDSANMADAKTIRMLIDHGADVNAADSFGRTPLMYAAGSDLLPADAVKLLIEKGANVNAKDGHANGTDTGWTALDIAKLRGNTPVVDVLVNAGAKPGGPYAAPVLNPRRENSAQKAVQDSLPLLQRSDANFIPKAGCFSCHNDSIPAMAIGLARTRAFRIDEKSAAEQVRANLKVLQASRDRHHQGFFVPVGDNFGPNVLAYALLGLHAENQPADLDTDAVAIYLENHQMPDGSWAYPKADTRPPICLDYIGQTALSMRALQLYAPKLGRADYEKAIQRAASWIAAAKPLNTDDLGWRAAGLGWASTDRATTMRAVKELLAAQRSDGGWSDLPTMESSAYATGKALVSLQIGGLPVTDPGYKRGVEYLLTTQQTDGSWFTKSRALAFQPYFDDGFPGGHDQWISSAATSWAAMALTLTMPEAKTASTRQGSAR
ncbi:MAG TPA: ankyrin repeat domain-containing protein [Bryobacteraceae bacterium]|nr:ankyrin repeat domain-containing protein [Bryobacteraceae bacterium]